MFCSFCGSSKETALLQLAVTLDLAAAHVQGKSAGCREGHGVPCRADEDQLIVLEAVGIELSPQVSTSYQSLLKVCIEEFVNFTHNGFWRTVFLPARTEIWISMWCFLELAVLQTYYKMAFDMKLSPFSPLFLVKMTDQMSQSQSSSRASVESRDSQSLLLLSVTLAQRGMLGKRKKKKKPQLMISTSTMPPKQSAVKVPSQVSLPIPPVEDC